MKYQKILVSFALIASAVISSGVQASTYTFDQGTLYQSNYDYGGMGSGRGIGFDVSTNFHMSSLGMNLGVSTTVDPALLYSFTIFSSSDGHTAGNALSSVQFNLGVGEGWRDSAFNFDFQAGNSYVINFSRVDGQWLDFQLGTIYSWEPSSLVNYGILTTVEGFEGAVPDNSNPLSAHFRMEASAVPVPAAAWLLGSGLLGLIGVARRKAA